VPALRCEAGGYTHLQYTLHADLANEIFCTGPFHPLRSRTSRSKGSGKLALDAISSQLPEQNNPLLVL
jgi:polyribonucleotide nucleotidyltransferase